jgi:DNA-binding CsgD family transcriptional regulator
MIHLIVILHFLVLAAGALSLAGAWRHCRRERSAEARWLLAAGALLTLLMVLDALRIYAAKNVSGAPAGLMGLVGPTAYALGTATVLSAAALAAAAAGQSLPRPAALLFLCSLPLAAALPRSPIPAAAYACLTAASAVYGFVLAARTRGPGRTTAAAVAALTAAHGLAFAATTLLPGVPDWIRRVPYSQAIYLASIALGALYFRGRGAGTPLPIPDVAARSAELGLSGREADIVAEVLLGKGNAEIGEKLFISRSTVKNHVYNIYRKLGIANRYELIARFSRERLE